MRKNANSTLFLREIIELKDSMPLRKNYFSGENRAQIVIFIIGCCYLPDMHEYRETWTHVTNPMYFNGRWLERTEIILQYI